MTTEKINLKSHGVEIRVPLKVLREIDEERGLLTRSKYAQRIFITREVDDEFKQKIRDDNHIFRKSWSKIKPLQERMTHSNATVPEKLFDELNEERDDIPLCVFIRGLIVYRNQEKATPKFPEVDDKFLMWLGGFFDGEGCVSGRPVPADDDKFGYHIVPFISITNTNKEAMQMIHEKLGFTCLQDEGVWKYFLDQTSGTREPCHRIVIRGSFKTQLFIDLLKNYVTVKKPHFEILTKLNYAIRAKQRWTKAEFINAIELCGKLQDLNRAVQRKHDAWKIIEELKTNQMDLIPKSIQPSSMRLG